MNVILPPQPFLTKSLALRAAETPEHLTNSQLFDCIEVLSSEPSKRQFRTALLQMLAAAVPLGK